MPIKQKIILIVFIAIYILLTKNIFAYQLPEYQIDCVLDAEKHNLQAKQKVIFTNNSDTRLSEIFFHIYPNRKYTDEEKGFLLRYAGYFKINLFPDGFQRGELKIGSVSVNNKAVSYEIEGEDQTMLRIILSEELFPQETIQLDIDFSLFIPRSYGRFGWHSVSGRNEIISLCRWYPVLSVLDEAGWHNYPFYLYHQPFFSEAANYKIKITLPENQIVAHSGFLKEKIDNKNNSQTLNIQSDKPLRDFSLTMSPDYKIYSSDYNGIKINSYYLAGDDFYGQKAAEFAKGLMDFYASRFGKYPYKEFSIAPVYLGYGGNQSSNIILMDTRIYKLPKFLIRYFDFLIAHETGHQWFFNLVGSDEYKEMWLDEGINSYFLLEYLESKYGRDASVMVLPKNLKWLIPNFSFREAATSRYLFLVKNGLDRPVLGELSSFKEPSSIFSLTYGKGSMVISMLRYLAGDIAFGRIFQRYFKEYSFSNIKVKDFIHIAQQECNIELDSFFHDWLETAEFCDYAVKDLKKEKIVLVNRGQINMPVKTKIDFSDGSSLIDIWDGNGIRDIPISSAKTVKKIIVDPEKMILDIDRTNNYWPKSLYKRVVGVYFFAYETPIFLNRDFYNLIYGPQISGSGLGLRSTLQKPYDNILSLSTSYDFNGELIKSVLGYEIQHVLDKQLSLGIEIFRDDDLDGKEEDLDGVKLYLRKELWPASYGLTEINDHISLYLLRNRQFEGSLISTNREEIEDFSYKRKHEAIAGISLSINRAGTYPDPETGFKTSLSAENAGHFMGGREFFTRVMADFNKYQMILPKQKLALHLKYGFGSPSDKDLYYLGGDEALRGYGRKTNRGSQILLSNIEYRFPLKENLNLRFIDNVFTLSGLQAVLFFDCGQSWHEHFKEARFKKDAGLGLRLHVDIGSFLEKLILRLDIARAINEPEEDTRFWLGLSHAF